MTDQLDLFSPDNRKKRPTRYKLEVVNDVGGVVYDMLVTEQPPATIRTALRTQNLYVRRPIVKGAPDSNLVYSELDPAASIAAAREFMARRATKRGAVLELLLDRHDHWVIRAEIRSVGGDSGDRRVRELRQDGWPIEIAQQTDKSAWACRLRLRPSETDS